MFGLQFHPLWTEVVNLKCKNQREMLLRVLNCILYSSDPNAQYVSQKDSKLKRAKAKKLAKSAIEGVYGKPSSPKFSHDLVLRTAIADHLYKTMKPGIFYSMPRALASCCLMSAEVGNTGGASMLSRALPSSMTLEADASEAVLVVPSAESQDLFFRIVASRPGSLKTVPLGPADARKHKVGRNTLSITFHDVYASGVTGPSVCVDPLPMPAFLAIDYSKTDELRGQLLRWSVDSAASSPPEFYIVGVPCADGIINRCL
jgi:hypothetical protein